MLKDKNEEPSETTMTLMSYLAMKGLDTTQKEFVEFANESQPTLRSWVARKKYNHRIDKLIEGFIQSSSTISKSIHLTSKEAVLCVQSLKHWDAIAPVTAEFVHSTSGEFFRIKDDRFQKHSNISPSNSHSWKWTFFEPSAAELLTFTNSILLAKPLK